MDTETLLQELELLNNGDRIKRMIEIGRLSKTDPATGELISQLWNGNKYEQLLALYSAHGSRDVFLALEAVKSQSKVLRSLALRLVILLATDDQAVDVAMTLPTSLQQSFVKQLKSRRRSRNLGENKRDVVDRLVVRLQSTTAAANTALFVKALPYASEQHVESFLPQAIDKFEGRDWYRLIQNHPTIAYRQILGWIESVTDTNYILEACASGVIRRLSESESTVDLGLNLFKKLLRFISPSSGPVEGLMSRRPVETVQLILDNGKYVPFRLHRFYSKLPTELLLKMFDFQARPFYNPNLGYLSREQMQATYYHSRQRQLDKSGMLGISILWYLPKDIRILEARRNIEISDTMNLEDDLIVNIAFLPWAEAMPLQAKSLTSGHMRIRQLALVSQIRAVKLQRERLIDALMLVHAHRNEPDPVRTEMYFALRTVKLSSWKEDHLDLMGSLIRDALDKADTSQGSVDQLGELTSYIGILHPIWAASQLALMMKEWEWVPNGRFALRDSSPKKARTMHWIEAIHPVILTWQTAKKYNRILEFAYLLGPRLELYPKLLDILEDLLSEETNHGRASDILRLLYRHRPKSTLPLVLSLLERDRSWIYLPLVIYLVTNLETHALTRFSILEFSNFEGRFAKRVPVYIHTDTGFSRWTIAQQKKYAESIKGDVIRGDRGDLGWPTILKDLSKLCFLDESNLTQFFTHEKPKVRVLATQSAARLDSPMKILKPYLDTLETDIARISVFSLGKILQDTSSEMKLQVLENVPLTKVTVAKEIVRLVAAIGTDEAFQYILELWSRSLHADVRVTLTKSLIAFQHLPQIWELFMEAASSSDHIVASSATNIPVQKFRPELQPRVASLYTALLQHADPRVQFAALTTLNSQSVPDDSSKLQLAAIKLLGSHDHSVPGKAAELIFRNYPKYFAADFPEQIAEAFKNPPSRVHLLKINYSVAELALDRKAYVATTQAILKALRESPNIFCKTSQGIQADTAISVLPWPENLRAIKEMAGVMHPDTIRTAVKAIQRVDEFESGNLEGLERALSGRESLLSTTAAAATEKRPASIFTAAEVERRLGLAALLTLGDQSQGWTEERVARLETYRQDKSLWISEVAHRFSLPGEMVQGAAGGAWTLVDRTDAEPERGGAESAA